MLGSLYTAIDSLTKPTMSILEWNLYLPIISNYLQHIFLEYLNSDHAMLVKAKYVKQFSKVKYTYKRFKKNYNLLYYFLAIFKYVFQFLSQYNKTPYALEASYSAVSSPTAPSSFQTSASISQPSVVT